MARNRSHDGGDGGLASIRPIQHTRYLLYDLYLTDQTCKSSSVRASPFVFEVRPMSTSVVDCVLSVDAGFTQALAEGRLGVPADATAEPQTR